MRWFGRCIRRGWADAARKSNQDFDRSASGARKPQFASTRLKTPDDGCTAVRYHAKMPFYGYRTVPRAGGGKGPASF